MLKKILSCFLACFVCLSSYGQGKKDSVQVFQEGDVDVNFLYNYYSQDGIHAAVTGGQGTEELKDQDASVIVRVPLDSVTLLDVKAGLNHYSSASTDKIDSKVSSASAKDNRAQIYIGYEKLKPEKRQAWSVNFGGSIESDYFSSSIAASYSWTSKNGNRDLLLQGQAFFDTWVVIFPEELRAPGLVQVPTDKRRSFNLTFSWSQVINKQLQMSLASDLVLQQGLLSTPFHRVFFRGASLPGIETLPLSRFKFPIGIRANYFATDFLVLRSYYRWYYDDFDILAHTASLEVPIKLGTALSVYPHYRYHTQTAAKWFAPFAEHVETARFYSSDYDLSAFRSHNYGVGLSIAPVFGLARMRMNNRGRLGIFKRLDIRYSRYIRSDGLSAYSVGLDFEFRL